MKKIAEFTILFLFLACTGFAQYTLETPDGKKVKLNKDGTWIYITSDNQKSKKYSVPATSNAKYVSKLNRYAIWYDPSQWFYDTVKKTNELTWDATFYSTDLDISGFLLESRLTTPLDQIETMIRDQWSGQGEVKSFTSFKDSINNLSLIGFDLLIDFSGVTYQYRGYIYSTLKGTFQFTLGTQKEVFEEDRNKINQLFQGMIKL